jgi:hypothetical protein
VKNHSETKIGLVALLAAAVCISAYAWRAATASGQDTHVSIPVNGKAPTSFDAELKDGKVVAMTAIYPDGTKLPLTQQSKPTSATSCPAGQTLTCWEDYDLLMSMCACVGGKRSSAVVSLGKL